MSRSARIAMAMAAFGCPALAQQSPGQSATATVHVLVIDSASARPITRVGLQVAGVIGLAMTDTTGRFTLPRIPLLSELIVRCPTTRRMVGKIVRRQPLHLEGRDTNIVVRLGATDCIEPPITSVHGEFRGHYTYGFESSDFRPCGGLPETAKAVGDTWGAAWVSFSDRADLRKVKWPSFPDSIGYPTVYVRWEGTMTGPGGYGHMSVAAFELVVDRVIELRKPRPDDCR